jgi:hypothetical protein
MLSTHMGHSKYSHQVLGVLRVLTLRRSECSHGTQSTSTGISGGPTEARYRTRHGVRGVCYLHALAAADWRRYRHRRTRRCPVGMPRRTLHAGASRISGSDPSSTRIGNSQCSSTVLCVVTVGTQTGCSECSRWVLSVLTLEYFKCSHWGTLTTHTRVPLVLTLGTRSTYRWGASLAEGASRLGHVGMRPCGPCVRACALPAATILQQ